MSRGRTPNDGRQLPGVAAIRPPRDLSVDEQEAWDAWVELIREARGFLATDAPLLLAVVELQIRKQRAAATAEKEGYYVEGRRHAALTDWDNAHRDWMAALRELGLTPASFKNVKASSRRTKGRDSLDDFNSSYSGN